MEEHYDRYSAPNIIRGVRSRGMRWARRVARMGDRRDAYRVGWGELRERELEVKRRIILKWLFKVWTGGQGLDWCRSK